MTPAEQQLEDAAKRCHEIITQHLSDQPDCIGQWVAIKLSDGSSDGNLYPFKFIAVRFQLHETQCAYIKIPPGGMGIREAKSFLRTNRQLYDAGMRIADPDKDLEIILPLMEEHRL